MPKGKKKRVFDSQTIVEEFPVEEAFTERGEAPVVLAAAPLEVHDLDSIELGKQQETSRREIIQTPRGEKYEKLIIPRAELVARFEVAGTLVMAEVLESEWFKGLLIRHHFSRDGLGLIKDDKGRFLLRSQTEDAYEVSRRIA